ncbi:hypothetical protein JR316_0009523 [Psilocybe cubensis]|uniref:Uncharacterized protein n=1 Tax=Psilocybe cubensis TaxID=181762 RepID=A0ACB8GQK7_PSICU|nr:hypothetical protein JR316_0009523 [Psilocybe cubensis]KAH9477319.1 hypothetical protein JR316_0009523 [Psilocybe cubensis]
MFARFAFTVSREKSRSTSKVKFSIPSRISHKRKRNADKASDEEERNAKTKRVAIDKDLELPSTISSEPFK